MAEIKSGATADKVTVDPTSKAMRISDRPIEGNRFRLAMQTGLLTVVAAPSATAGHLFAFRWGSSASVALIHRIRARWLTVAGFTAAQEVGMDIVRATGYSASHTGGTAATLTSPNLKKRQSMAASLLTDARIGATGALTAGTHTLDANAIAFGGYSELAAAATVQKGSFELNFDGMVGYGPLELATNEGFVLRNSVLMGAGGTARVAIEIDWTEVGLGTNW